jgi:nucleotide-binding universal stress UspA family protein
MTIRTILVPLHGDTQDGRTLAAAAEIARRIQAHIVALYCDADPAEILHAAAGWEGSSAIPDSMMASLRSRAESRRAAAERSFSDWLSQSDIPFALTGAGQPMASAELAVATGQPLDVVGSYAVASDLIITSRQSSGEPDRAAILQSTLFDTGRPVLALPAGDTSPLFTAPVAIAWNYSAEAARAVDAALPIIEAVGEAVVLMAGHHEDDEAGRRITAYLSWHGVQARVVKLGKTGQPSHLMAAKLHELRTGLLVMGAYSHTRARQFVFGGMTGYMLENAPVPLLLAH